MIANYHTHTSRCGHAVGRDRDYVRRAVRAGLQVLGFSDHTPQPSLDGKTGKDGIRMRPAELPGYVSSIRALADEFRDRLEILTGVEAEYYPRHFAGLLAMLQDNGVQYMILGEHFLGLEPESPYCGRPTGDSSILDRYVSQCCEAMDSGLFTCFAHPDLIRFIGEPREYERQIRKLCRKALDTHTPLEINLLGIREKRHYPDPGFWRIAAEEGCMVILGCDAHRPQDLTEKSGEAAARRLAQEFGLTLLETVPVRMIGSR